MKVTLNGEQRDIPHGVTVLGLLEHLALTSGPVAVELNRQVVPRAEHGGRIVNEGDAVEIVHLVGGG